MGSAGQYIDIPGNSQYYIYDDGDTIDGWSYGEFAALISKVVDEIDWDGGERFSTADHVKQAFADHFGGVWDDDYRGGIAPPERGEIFCQCVDGRIDSLELTDDLQEAVQEWVDDFDALRECDHCGNSFRPYIYNEDTVYRCSSRECRLIDNAEMNGLTPEQQKELEDLRSEKLEEVDGFDIFNDALDEVTEEYLEEHSTLDIYQDD